MRDIFGRALHKYFDNVTDVIFKIIINKIRATYENS